MIRSGIFSVALLLYSASALYGETLFMNDGSITKGKILSENSSVVQIMDSTNKRRSVSRGEIMRILYTDLSLGRVYVQKKDGSSFEGYIVDEEQTMMTFRSELRNTSEFKVKRSEIMFISENNPSMLNAVVNGSEIRLTWVKPFRPAKVYKIYGKTKKDSDFKLVSKTAETSFATTHLPGSTTAFFMVTAVSDINEESSASNIVEVRTNNLKPERPHNITRKITVSGDGYTASMKVSWEPSIDPDGEVQSYNLYRIENNLPLKFGETKTNNFVINNIPAGNTVRYAVRAEDAYTAESDSSYFVYGSDWHFGISGSPAFALPLGRFGEYFKPGFGALVNAGANRYFIGDSRVESGIELSGMYYPGKNPEVENLITGGISLYFNPYIIMYERIEIGPVITAGISYVKVSYTKYNAYAAEMTGYDPVCTAGIRTRYSFGTYFAGLSVRYGIIAETGALHSQIIASIEAGGRL